MVSHIFNDGCRITRGVSPFNGKISWAPGFKLSGRKPGRGFLFRGPFSLKGSVVAFHPLLQNFSPEPRKLAALNGGQVFGKSLAEYFLDNAVDLKTPAISETVTGIWP